MEKLKLLLIRHGKTQGNLEGRYIGTTDEDLCQSGREELLQKIADACYQEAEGSCRVEKVFASPLKRCVQTAELIYPQMLPCIYPDFREMDFGEFENHNYKELNGNAKYQEWIDSNGTLPFPAGEDKQDFHNRVCQAFVQMVESCMAEQIACAACVVHGGVIMEIMDSFAVPKQSYYDWQVKNGCGYAVEVEIKDGNFIICVTHRICAGPDNR
jgi:alpha-ribazole phosphatase